MKRRRLAIWMGLALLFLPASGFAETEVERIGPFDPRAPIPIPDPSAAGLQPDDRLLLDGVDVATWARAEGTRIWIELPFDLADGEHFVSWTRDGELQGEVRFRTGAAPSAVHGSVGGFVSLEASQRLVDRNLPSDTPHRFQLQGSADLNASAGRGEFDRWPYAGAWSVDARVPTFYDRIGSEGPDRSAWGLGDFQLNGRLGPFGVRAGHFLPANPSLVLEGFTRRGTEASIDLAPLRSRVTGFAVRTEPITGFREGLGISDREQRVHGLTVETQAIDYEGIALSLQGTYLRGRGQLDGVGVDGEFAQDLRSGTAWSTVADLHVWSRRIRLRGEFARTRFERDTQSGEGPRRDEAYSVLASFTPWLDASLFGSPFSTTLQFEQREVGPAFESLANPLAPIDRELQELRWETRWGGFGTRFSFAREKDNVDHRAELPRFRTDFFDGDLRWSGAAPAEDARLWRRLVGAPFWSVGWSRERLKPIRGVDPEGLVAINLFPSAGVFVPLVPGLGIIPVVIGSPFGTPLDPQVAPFPEPILDDRSIRTSRLQLGSQYGRFGFSASHMVRRTEDRTRRDPDRRTDLTSFDLNWSLGERSRLTLGYQRQRDREEDRGFQTTTTQGRVGLDVSLKPDVVRVGGDVSLSRTRDSRTTDLTVWTATGFAEWTVRRPDGLVPGVQLSLTGTLQDFQDDEFRDFNGNQYQAFLTATVWWERTP